jgi:uncharacterized protein GlcG (DUF336 family)
MSLTYSRAAELVSKSLASAEKQSAKVAVVVVDRGGHIVAAGRMDGVGYFNIDAARGKAAASANFGAPTHAVAHMAGQDPLLSGALHAAPGLVILPGGFPIMDGAEIVGGIGAAGSFYTTDQAVLEAALQ